MPTPYELAYADYLRRKQQPFDALNSVSNLFGSLGDIYMKQQATQAQAEDTALGAGVKGNVPVQQLAPLYAKKMERAGVQAPPGGFQFDPYAVHPADVEASQRFSQALREFQTPGLDTYGDRSRLMDAMVSNVPNSPEIAKNFIEIGKMAIGQSQEAIPTTTRAKLAAMSSMPEEAFNTWTQAHKILGDSTILKNAQLFDVTTKLTQAAKAKELGVDYQPLNYVDVGNLLQSTGSAGAALNFLGRQGVEHITPELKAHFLEAIDRDKQKFDAELKLTGAKTKEQLAAAANHYASAEYNRLRIESEGSLPPNIRKEIDEMERLSRNFTSMAKIAADSALMSNDKDKPAFMRQYHTYMEQATNLTKSISSRIIEFAPISADMIAQIDANPEGSLKVLEAANVKETDPLMKMRRDKEIAYARSKSPKQSTSTPIKLPKPVSSIKSNVERRREEYFDNYVR